MRSGPHYLLGSEWISISTSSTEVEPSLLSSMSVKVENAGGGDPAVDSHMPISLSLR